MKLLQGEATQIFSVKAAQLNIKELDIQLEYLEDKLINMSGDERVGNKSELIEVDGEGIPHQIG